MNDNLNKMKLTNLVCQYERENIKEKVKSERNNKYNYICSEFTL